MLVWLRYGNESFIYLLCASLEVEVACVIPGQTPGQAPGQDESIEIGFHTCGSRYSNDICILKNGVVVNAREVSRYMTKGDRYTKVVGGVRIVVVDRSSRKNIHVSIFIPSERVLAIISEMWGEYRVRVGKGRVEGEEKVETWVNERYEYEKRVINYYYVEDGEKILIGKREYEPTRKLIGLPRVTIETKDGKVIVRGDTYHIKDALKLQGGRWNPDLKAWVFDRMPNLDGVAEVEGVR